MVLTSACVNTVRLFSGHDAVYVSETVSTGTVSTAAPGPPLPMSVPTGAMAAQYMVLPFTQLQEQEQGDAVPTVRKGSDQLGR